MRVFTDHTSRFIVQPNTSVRLGNIIQFIDQTDASNRYSLSKEIIINDLSKEHPQWILSAYGPGRDAPLQLFGGLPREQSFEEMRLHHYIAAASGNQTQAILEAQGLVKNAEQQMQTVLRDVDGAINYIIDGAKTHPNRIDVCKGQGGNGQSQPSALGGPQPAFSSTVGQPAALGTPTSTFGQPASTFGQPSASGRPQQATLGQPSIPPTQPLSTFGQPSSTFGRPSTSFGQPCAGFGQPSLGTTQAVSSFGHPSAFGTTSSTPSALGQPTGFGAAQQSTSSFGQPSNPFGQATAISHPQTAPFGQPSQPAQPGAFGQPTQSTQPGPFAQSPLPTQPSGFGQPSQPTQSTGFGQPSQPTQPSSFGQPSQPTQPSGFGLPAKPPVPATNGTFGAPPPTTNGHSAQRDAQGKLTIWHGKPISLVDGDPCYRRPDGTWEKIWFPDGPPGNNKDTQLPDEAYDERTKEAYMFMKEHKTFKDGIMPDKPPKREWCDWDF